MSNSELQLYTIVIVSIISVTVFILGLFLAPKGRFIRTDPGRKRRDFLILKGFSVFYSSKVETDGGFYEYSGFWFLGRCFLTRRDHGIQLLINQGYPKEIAKLRSSKISAKLIVKKKPSDSSQSLIVYFTPYKVGFTHQPPRITNVSTLKQEVRIYSKLNK